MLINSLPPWLNVFILSWIAGLAMPFGAFLSSLENLKPNWLDQELRHFITAFGGGALLSAIALVFIPESTKVLNIPTTSFYFLLGGIVFAFLNIILNKSKTQASNFLAMLSDFIPETLALGALLAKGSSSALLITFLMALQNIPEAFTTYRELASEEKGKKIIWFLFFISFIGPIVGLAGFHFFANRDQLIAAIELIASGGILYLVFQNIAPQAKLKKAWFPPFGALLGFLLGLIGHMFEAT